MNSFGDNHVSFNAMFVSYSPDGKYLLVSTDRERLIMYRVGCSTPVRNFYGALNDTYSQPRHCWHPSGKYIYSTSQNNKLYCWEISNQAIVSTLEGHTAVPRDLSYNVESKLLASCSFDKTVRLWSE